MAVHIASALESFCISYLDGGVQQEVTLSAPNAEKAKEYLRNYVPSATLIVVTRN